jgi:hypothetical protein
MAAQVGRIHNTIEDLFGWLGKSSTANTWGCWFSSKSYWDRDDKVQKSFDQKVNTVKKIHKTLQQAVESLGNKVGQIEEPQRSDSQGWHLLCEYLLPRQKTRHNAFLGQMEVFYHIEIFNGQHYLTIFPGFSFVKPFYFLCWCSV